MFGVNGFGLPYFGQGYAGTNTDEPVTELPAAGPRRTWVLRRLTGWLLPARATTWLVSRRTEWTVR